MKFRKNMKIGVSIIFLLLIFTTSISFIDFSTKSEIDDNNSPSISVGDDLYEPNNFRDPTIFMLGEYSWLSSFNGPGIQLDDDYYKIDVWFGYQQVRINLTYVQTFGNIDLELWDDYGNSLAISNTPTNNEFIDLIVPYNGIYYIRVFGNNSGNSYDLIWESLFTDDYYEENDDNFNAYDLSFDEGRWLSQIMGRAGQFDDDYYRIQVKSGQQRLIVFLRFYHLEGNIDLELRDTSNSIVASRTSISDNEFMDIIVTPGIYYLRVYYGNYGNPYDLLWEDRNQLIFDDDYEPNDAFTSAYDISTKERTWLSNSPPNKGLGIQSNDDWYQVYIDFGMNSLYVELVYSNTQGNIGIGIYDTNNNFLGGFSPLEGAESFGISLSSGRAYNIKVYGNNTGGVVYNLWWEDFYWDAMSDDSYEYNNNSLKAFDLTPYQGLKLTEIYGFGYQFDDDWFKIYVEPGNERLILEMFLDNFAGGDIDVKLFDSSLTLVEVGYETFNKESIDTILSESGWYYILVYGPNFGNNYDLKVLTTSPIGDDPYELNDDYDYIHPGHPSFLTQNEQTWLSDLEGAAVQGDEDWYAIEITPGFLNLEVWLSFNRSLGDIYMEIQYLEWTWGPTGDRYPNAVPTGIVSHWFDDNSEYINENVTMGPGVYFIKVHGSNSKIEYDLWWDDIKTEFSDDIYEENDIPDNAYVGMEQNMWLWGGYSDEYSDGSSSTPNIAQTDNTGAPQLALQYDNDWYKITVESGFERLIVEMKYDIAEGMLGFEIYNVNLTEITGNFSMIDDAKIDYVLPSSGVYYIRVYGDNTGNVYNLRYFTSEDFPLDQIPGYDTLILIISIVGVSAVVIKKKRSKFKHK